MPSRKLLLVVACMALATLVVATSIAVASVPPDVLSTLLGNGGGENIAPQKLAPGTGFPGVYAARDWRIIDPEVYPVVGGHETFSWKELEPTEEGVYDWSRLDNFVARQVAAGKKAALGITTYNGRIEGGLAVPDWFRDGYPEALIACGPLQIPRYWHSTYLTKYGNFVNALANHLGTNPDVSYVQIGVGLYGETQPSDDADDGCVIAAMDADFGLSSNPERSAKWVETVKAINDAWGQAFAGRQRLFSVYTPRFLSVCEKRDIVFHGAENYNIGLFAGGIYADTVTVFSLPPGGMGCQKWDPILYWNNVATKTIPIALESYRYMLPDYDSFYWGVLSALNKHADYLSLETSLLYDGTPSQPITENFDMIRFANAYLGKTPADAPNAWIALRETSPAHNGWGCNRPNVYFPQFGDYDYWLYRDDTAPGGRTMTATTTMTYVINDSFCGTIGTVVNDPRYVPMLAGKGPEGWMTRRTDRASGNDYMYFRVDDSFIAGQGITSAVFITVTYFDYGSDTWALEYKTSAGVTQTLTVNKTGSEQWATRTFTIMDMSFSGLFANGNDFRIYNGGSGDEYVHMVMVGKYRPAGPTPTPTRTRTPTQTATPTPITVVFQQGMLPSSSYAGAADTFISNYGDPTTNYGSSTTVNLRNNGLRTGLFSFDVSSIPGHAVIESAVLSVHTDYRSNSNPLAVSVYEARRTWTEMEATWINATSTTQWDIAGANNPNTDFYPTPLDSATLTAADAWYTFNVTSAVQKWVQTAAANRGLILRTEPGGSVEYKLRSGDYYSSPQYRPKLTISYRLPSGPTPTATATAQPVTPTRTPTRTPTMTLLTFQRGVSPGASYSGVADTFISNFSDGTSNYGSDPILRLRSNDVRAALLRFDLASIPASANIVSATLSVHVDHQSNDKTMTVSLYRMMRPWAENETTWFNASTSVAWAVPGANGGSDRSATALSSVVMSSSNVWYDFDVTSLVRQWLTGGNNYGVILKAATGPSVEYGLRSSEYFAAPTYRPKLTIACFGCTLSNRLYLPVILSLHTTQ